MSFRDEFMIEHHPTPMDIKNWTINQILQMNQNFYQTDIKDYKNNNEVVIKMKYYPGKKVCEADSQAPNSQNKL